MQRHFYEGFLLFGYSLSKLFTCKLKWDDLLISTKQFHQFLQPYILVLQLTMFVNSPFYYNNFIFRKMDAFKNRIRAAYTNLYTTLEPTIRRVNIERYKCEEKCFVGKDIDKCEKCAENCRNTVVSFSKQW